MVDKELARKFREKFYYFIEEDNEKWKVVGKEAAGYDWIEYHSPTYFDSVSFVYTTLGNSCEVYVKGYLEYSFSIYNPVKMIKIRRLIKDIKIRHIRERQLRVKELVREKFVSSLELKGKK